jgi:hypothetical protein
MLRFLRCGENARPCFSIAIAWCHTRVRTATMRPHTAHAIQRWGGRIRVLLPAGWDEDVLFCYTWKENPEQSQKDRMT